MVWPTSIVGSLQSLDCLFTGFKKDNKAFSVYTAVMLDASHDTKPEKGSARHTSIIRACSIILAPNNSPRTIPFGAAGP